jgi:hypothetical protein
MTTNTLDGGYYPPTRPTRYAELGYCRLSANLWRIVDMSTDSVIGPHYATKGELLADLGNYARDFMGVQS